MSCPKKAVASSSSVSKIGTKQASVATGSAAVLSSASAAASSAPASSPATSAAPSSADSPTAVSQIPDGQAQAPAPSTLLTQTVTKGTTAVATQTATGAPASSASSCPASLSGTFEYPHLIVPVSKSSPNNAYGTSYNGKFTSEISTVFNFDLPASYAGKTCSLVFLLPTTSSLKTSSYNISGTGGLDVYELSTPVTESVTYATLPTGPKIGGAATVAPGNSYVLASHACAAGSRLSMELVATGDLSLDYFQDYNAPGIGAYISVC